MNCNTWELAVLMLIFQFSFYTHSSFCSDGSNLRSDTIIAFVHKDLQTTYRGVWMIFLYHRKMQFLIIYVLCSCDAALSLLGTQWYDMESWSGKASILQILYRLTRVVQLEGTLKVQLPDLSGTNRKLKHIVKDIMKNGKWEVLRNDIGIFLWSSLRGRKDNLEF